MKFFYLTITIIVCAFCISNVGFAQTIPVDAGPPDHATGLVTALAFANGGNADVLELVTDGGVYELSKPDSISVPLTIRAKDGLTNKPIIRVAAGDTCDIFLEVWADFTLEGVIFDGKRTDGTLNPFDDQSLIANVDHPDGTFPRNSLTIRNCEFRNCYKTADPEFDEKGNGIRAKADAIFSNILIENTLFENIIDEAIVYQNAYKDGPTGTGNERIADTLWVRNCTFINCGGPNDQGIITVKGDNDTTTVDAKIYLENLTFYSSNPRCIYSREREGMVVRNIVIANNRTGRDGSLIRIDRNGSVISHIDTFATGGYFGGNAPIRAEAGDNTGAGMATLDSATIYAFDPEFADPGNGDLTVKNAELYTLAHDGGLLGDPRWADPALAIIDHSVISNVPEDFSLSQNYPNPFNPVTTIRYSLDKTSDISIKVYSLTGKLVETLYTGNKPAGEYSITWDASHLASGVYFYKLVSGSDIMTRKMMLLK
jgi:hypothetical protein